ncbi:unnamed protein product [Amoebophrya sp. A25]|nr:unnamed protein product [Amoebophrya sp. A25]|eukprot:GSA25T00003965001.1
MPMVRSYVTGYDLVQNNKWSLVLASETVFEEGSSERGVCEEKKPHYEFKFQFNQEQELDFLEVTVNHPVTSTWTSCFSTDNEGNGVPIQKRLGRSDSHSAFVLRRTSESDKASGELLRKPKKRRNTNKRGSRGTMSMTPATKK